MSNDIRRNVVSAQLLTRLAAEHGLGMEACLQGTKIDEEAFADPQTEISAGQELQVVRNILRHLGHIPGLGLDAGQRYRLSSYGIWGFALASSPTFRSAAQIAIRYLDLSYAFVRFRIEQRGPDLLIMMDDSEIPEDLRQFLVERDFAAWANAAGEMRPGGFPSHHAHFRFARPAYAERFTKLAGVEPSFGEAINAVIIDAAFLDEPLPQANPMLARLCEEQCRQLLAKRLVREGVAGQVRDRLLRLSGKLPSITEIADELCMAPRSLRRRLDEEGTSFRALLDEVRQALAEEMLTTVGMKLDEVASRLGYAEPASFIHAFKRWKGVSPNVYREQQRKGN
jgi:AraC-like DNA-binding protein